MTISKSTILAIVVSLLIGGFLGYAAHEVFVDCKEMVQCHDLPPVMQ